ncbi:DUF1613-domain-containing protein [Dacryopinax primogenitus]|uniref:tRNA (uracil-O(2)-)-methyltransferase n=1 Tax=Dacryopinax primogenitus (strain DJM 731) TaxID=1858805 RepID=M5G647_DACPD|nr:DUF1613-domain-containing protein [Dacryopinax primogenitus]EJT99227.1 DUF1613-domain-containing protein [Dacryopinax primogenitus]
MSSTPTSSPANPQSPRPPFLPVPLSDSESTLISSLHLQYTPILSAPAPFPLPSFSSTITALLQHPERTGPLILRAEPLPPPVPPIPGSTELFKGWRPVEVSRRRLLPRVPERDGELIQTCVRYRRSNVGERGEGEMLVLTPELLESASIPYYHPDVQRLALIYTSSPLSTEDGAEAHGQIQIEVVLPPSAPSQVSSNSRLYRTCLHLLETTHKHSWGHLSGYRKRVRHDVLLPRAEYQDLYMRLKQRHKHHVSSWSLGTDPRKHVFEVKKAELDVAIAAFLMLLWKLDYPALGVPRAPLLVGENPEREERCEWSTWGRPEGGFVDLGCGNGLLVHILLQEGYEGYGIDLSPRKTWASFSPSTQAHLHAAAISPLSSPPVSPPLPPGAFLLGNHADELTPYVPLLATLHAASGWLVIPCCAYTFTARFTATSYRSRLGRSEVEQRMDEGGEGGGRVRAYLVWLEEMGRGLGWSVGLEALRMPSTRNWGLVGRRAVDGLEEDGEQLEIDGEGQEERGARRVVSREEGLLWAKEKLEEIRCSGGFQVREGKGHGHH